MGIAESRLDSFTLFAELGSPERSFIAANCQEAKVASGNTLIQEGQVGKDVYLLETGTVRAFRGKAASAQDHVIISGPTILGEMAMADPSRIRTLSVVAESELSLLSIPISTFLIFVRSCPSLKEKLRELIAVRKAELAARKSTPVAA